MIVLGWKVHGALINRHNSRADPQFCDRGFKFTKGGSIS